MFTRLRQLRGLVVGCRVSRSSVASRLAVCDGLSQRVPVRLLSTTVKSAPTDASEHLMPLFPHTTQEAELSVMEILSSKIAPAIQADGGDIHFERVDLSTGIVYVRQSGACISCEKSTVTMRFLVQNALKHYQPWVTAVKRIDYDV